MESPLRAVTELGPGTARPAPLPNWWLAFLALWWLPQYFSYVLTEKILVPQQVKFTNK